MKTNLEKYINEVQTGFQTHKGKASVYCLPPINFADVIYHVIKSFHAKSPYSQIFIVVDEYATRKAILSRLKLDKTTDYNVKVLSSDYINTKYKYNYRLIITVGINDNIELITFLNSESTFLLCLLTKNIMNTTFISSVRNILPNIDVTVSNESVRSDSIYSPVEEVRLGVDFNKDSKELYDKCTEYISSSVSIFGDLSNIEKCKIGDTTRNISASEFREEIARSNGWSETLDTTIEWNKQIDDIYNPNILFERANTFYNITKERRNLVMDCPEKLAVVVDICENNKDKNILIVSKRGEFASLITKTVNVIDDVECGDYHDNIESMNAVDAYGEPILVKSGKDKGQFKIMGAQAISTLNMRRFNVGDINVLSIKNSSSNKLKISVDMVIFTTPFILDIVAFKSRFNDIDFRVKPTLVYKVFVRGTIEQNHLSNQKESSLITVIEDENYFIGYNEN